MSLRLTILGSGTSHGIPMIACDCPVCTSPDPHDRRTRTSALFSFDDRHVLIDTPPELRLQCVACNVRRIDAVLITHAHADHIAGLDDLRRFNYVLHDVLDVYGNDATLDRLERMFAYAFRERPYHNSAIPHLRARRLTGPVELFGRTITPIPYAHGTTEVYGYRVGDMAYCPDCSGIPDASRALLAGLEVLVLDGLRHTPHPTHFNLEQAIAEAQRIGARRTYFTHIAHELQHATVNAELPDGMQLAYDGLVLET